MLALFCLRLAFGMLACLTLLPAKSIHPRFYRTHLLTAFGLMVLALTFLFDRASLPLLGSLGTAIVLSFLGSFLWRVEGAPGGQAAIVLTLLALAASVCCLETQGQAEGGGAPTASPYREAHGSRSPEIFFGDLTSAALLGTAMSAMLLGHSYLIAPGMALAPLMRLLGAFGVAVLARMATDGFVIWRWSAKHSFVGLGNDTLLWLPVRWLIGFVLPLVLGWMAWQSARIRSTQSATGILYVVVVFCFLGELTGLLLRDTAGLTM